MKKPKKPKKTEQEKAMERRQTMMLDEEIEESEDRFRALARGSLGKKSLLSRAASTRAQSAGGGRGTSRASSAPSSMLPSGFKGGQGYR